MLYIILQITVFQALFILVYDVFLRKETFFNYNRAYLLITSILSFVLPFIKFPKLKAITTQDLVIQLPEVFIGAEPLRMQNIQIAEQAGVVLEQPSIPVWQIGLGLGMLITLMIFVFKILKLYWMKEKYPRRWKGNVLVVRLIKSSAAFSFFNTIFLGDSIPKEQQPTVYIHELVHVKEYHSIDLLYFELLRIVMWFNPLIYLYQNRITELHEYIADANAVKHQGTVNYYKSLLNQVFDVNQMSFTNTFFKSSLIKKRITMLQKSKSKHYHIFKYALLIPVVIAMLIYTSTEVRAQEDKNQTEQASQELTEEQLIKSYYDAFVAMEKNGASFMEISSYAGFGKYRPEKYILSKEEFLKSKAYRHYVAEGMIKRKSEKGTLENEDFDAAELMKQKGKSYVEYRSWKKTKEAKDLWEASIRDGERKLFIEDMLNKTEEEQQRYDALLNQLETDESVEKVIITDGKSLLILYPTQKDELHEINIPAETSIEVPFAVIEEVPTTKDCKDLTTNEERKRCMSEFIAKHVNKNFNIDLADSLGLKGRQRIFVAFKIDKQGLIKDAQARAVHPDLETEAIRVINTLPEFIPGKQKGEAVIVPYSLPIVLQITGGTEQPKAPNYNRFRDSLSTKNVESLSEIPFSVVDKAPIHPDCKDLVGIDQQKKCTSNAVASFVNRNFNMDLVSKLGLSEGQKRVFVKFVIDNQGYIKSIGARGPHPKVEEEAKCVIALLPQFIPGEQDGKTIDVAYSLPIQFQLVNDKKRKN
ncbi:hypothetical protein J4050_02585 [Winogradskyella sp. DF17]|uniref:Peptidase M56 domain-containing protein n=1 Tax=Winogradskyella pelagia TaxID=2819984 RepID=A0ABS3T037_9FLAO|nr:M56 family metallopeptidase [Winogradskyella sp. DF17]MBO3115614.1 hypothetical protein [Winogradskyella sp. DF17]